MRLHGICSSVVLFLLAILPLCSTILQYKPVGNYFPSCLDIIDVYPYPHSTLKPVGEHGGYTVYTIQVTFSKAITLYTRKELSTFILTPLLTTEKLDVSTEYIRSWHGSERKYVLFFHVNHTEIAILRVYFVVNNAMSKELVLNLANRGVLNKDDKHCDNLHLTTMKCYSRGIRYTSTISVATVISEYYLSGSSYLLKFPQLPPRVFQPNPYCNIETKRPHFHVASDAHLRSDTISNSTYVRSQALLGFKTKKGQENIYLDIPITLQGRFQRRHAIRLPRSLKALVTTKGLHVTVKLSDYLGVQISQEENDALSKYKLHIPAGVQDIYELREKTVLNEYRYYGDVPRLMREKYNKAVNVSIVCPPDSMRNPSGHPKLYTSHQIEYGSLYHLIVPQLPKQWQDNYAEQTVQAFRANISGKIAEELEVFHEKQSEIRVKIIKALKEFVCLLPSTSELSNFNSSDSTGSSWVVLDKCIFVPYNVAFSSECGGLQVFKEIKSFKNDSTFCDFKLGHCIGKRFSSPFRFPMMRTYGMPELTGWIPCKNCIHYSDEQEHPSGILFNNTVKAISRSLLKYKYRWRADKHTGKMSKYVYSATIVLTPEITTPVDYNDLKLRVRLKTGVSVVYPELAMFDSLGCEYIALNLQESLFSTSTNLTVTISNSGKGGGDVSFELQCLGLLQVYPLTGKLKKWINPKSELSVTFQLNSESAESFELFVHHCNVTVRIPRYHNTDILSVCPKSIYTYHGIFHHPCVETANLLPANLVYFSIPASDEGMKILKQKLRTSLLDQKYTILKGISIVPRIRPSQYMNMAQISAARIFSAYIYCDNKHVIVLADHTLTLLNIPHKLQPHLTNVLQYNIDMATKKVYFLSTKKTPGDTNGVSTLCTLRLLANQPNGYCATERVTMEEVFIPFSTVDLQTIQKKREFTYKGHNMDFLRHLYGWQPFEIFFAMIACVLMNVLLCIFIATGYSFKHYFRKKFPNNIFLIYLKLMLKEAMNDDQRFWADPNSYLEPPDPNFPYGVHFILYNFKSTQPFSTEDLSKLKLAGVLCYKDKELPVVVGDINYIFIARRPRAAAIWLYAASGIYLLQLKNCSPEYRKEMSSFLQKKGVKKE